MNIKQYLLNGPQNTRTLPRTALAFMLWWKVWVMVWLISAAFLLAYYIQSLGLQNGPLWMLSIGYILAQLLNRLDLQTGGST